MQEGYPNAWGARIPLETNWNLELLASLLEGYEDKVVVDWLRYGWPISRSPNWKDPIPTFKNHASACEYPDAINAYIEKELKRGAVCSPFPKVPFKDRIGVSPMSTRPKRDVDARRIIMDLSWPPGSSVNDGIGKDQFMGFSVKLSFPTIDIIARRVASMESEQVYLFKIDLAGYFRQLPLDPGDYSLLCFVWNGEVYFNIVLPMGLRSAPYFAQHTSDVIRYMHDSAGYFLFNYIDDLIGVEEIGNIWVSYKHLQTTLQSIGLKEVEEKRVEPTQILNCVGTLVNTKEMTLGITQDRKLELCVELDTWISKERCSVKELQRLIGKLHFVCAVIRPSRLFMSRMLEFLWDMGSNRGWLTPEFWKDVQWWRKYLPGFQGTCIMWMYHIKKLDQLAASHACLTGMGAVAGKEYIKLEFPENVQSRNIAYLELLAIVIMCKTWKDRFQGNSAIINWDNEVVVQVLNSGRARDSRLLELMREMVYVATGKFEFQARHLRGKFNILPDLLSCWAEGKNIHNKFFQLIDGTSMCEIPVAHNVCEMTHCR